MFIRGASEVWGNVSIQNACAHNLTNGNPTHDWRGPILLTHIEKQDTATEICKDVTGLDMRNAVDHFISFRN